MIIGFVVSFGIHSGFPMPKARRSRRRYRGYRKLPFTATIVLLTTAADVVVSFQLAEVFTEERRILSVEATWGVEDLTSGDGPLEVGLSHSDYSSGEVEESLEAVGAWDEGNKVIQEQAARLVRTVGLLSEAETTLNDGQPMKTRLNWRMATADTLRFWCRNRGDDLTTGAEIVIQGHCHTVLV